MSYEEGEDLEEYMKKEQPPMPQNEIYEIILPILNGLEEVHSNNFLHRDIKPANIFIRANKTPMLIDFGASRFAMGVKSKSLSVVLTEGYAPKEQYSSTSKQGAYTDIYSIGAVMYKMATGNTPPEASSRSDYITDGEDDPYERLSDDYIAPYSDGFKIAVDKALEFRAKDRPQSVEEFRELLTSTVSSISSKNTKTKIVRPNSRKKQKTKIIRSKNINNISKGNRNNKSKISYTKFIINYLLITLLLASGGYYYKETIEQKKIEEVKKIKQAKELEAYKAKEAKRELELKLDRFKNTQAKKDTELKKLREEKMARLQKDKEKQDQLAKDSEAKKNAELKQKREEKRKQNKIAKDAEAKIERELQKLKNEQTKNDAELKQLRAEKQARLAKEKERVKQESALKIEAEKIHKENELRKVKAKKETEKKAKYSLTIVANPHNAKVQITNIKQRYHTGIKLKKGSYKIKISKKGYRNKEFSINLKHNIYKHVKLVKISTKTKVTASKGIAWHCIAKSERATGWVERVGLENSKKGALKQCNIRKVTNTECKIINCYKAI